MKKYFNNKNFLRVIIIFTVGFISRFFIHYMIDISAYYNFLHIIYFNYMIVSIFIILVYEFLTYYEFNIILYFLKWFKEIIKNNTLFIRCKNIKISFIRKIVDSYYNNNSKMSVKPKVTRLPKINDPNISTSESSYKNVRPIRSLNLPGFSNNTRTNSNNTIYTSKVSSYNNEVYNDFISETYPSNINELKLRIISPVYRNEWAWAFDGRNKDNWDESKFRGAFNKICNKDFANFVNNNRNSIIYSDRVLYNSSTYFIKELYNGKYLDEALKELPSGIRDSYKQYLLNLEKTR